MREENIHYFHIPVMGTGFSIDTPLKVAPLGITSVVSLVDDILIEQIRTHYCEKFNIPFQPISKNDPDSRANRITAYLDLLEHLIQKRFDEIVSMPFGEDNDKARYFNLLPDSSSLKKLYIQYMKIDSKDEKERVELELNSKMRRGLIEVNIMTKLDRQIFDENCNPREGYISDAKSALKGFAQSKVKGNIVFSAGMNPTLYGYMEQYSDFYRGPDNKLKKGVVLKVNDYRSALIQGKFLAKKGIEISEYRIESSINCGGHAFVMKGQLIGPILQEFSENKEKLSGVFYPLILKYYENKKLPNAPAESDMALKITYQGGLGNSGENTRILDFYNFDGVGWATPFLLAPEVSSVDDFSRKQLAEAGEGELYLSDRSPMNIPFHNLKASTSIQRLNEKISRGDWGAACRKGFLVSNTTYSKTPICLASREFKKKKMNDLGMNPESGSELLGKHEFRFLNKECICHNLGNSALIQLGIMSPEKAPVSVCPGPNLAYFNGTYTLEEIVGHIYGKTASITENNRPHFFEKELNLYIERLEFEISECRELDNKLVLYFKEFCENMFTGIDYYRDICNKEGFEDENLDSLKNSISSVRERVLACLDSLPQEIQ